MGLEFVNRGLWQRVFHQVRTHSSAGERSLHTGEVQGSIPCASTITANEIRHFSNYPDNPVIFFGAVWRPKSYCRWYLSRQRFRGSIDLGCLGPLLWVPDNERQKRVQVRQKIQSRSSSHLHQDPKRPPSYSLPGGLRGRRPVCMHPADLAIAA